MKLVRLLLFLSLIAVLGIFTISATPYVEAYDIPDWIESLAGMWFSGMIDDNTFGTALDWLIDNFFGPLVDFFFGYLGHRQALTHHRCH